MKLALQSLEVSISQRIIDGICGFELLPWLATPYAKNMVAGDGVLSEL
ncbi:hypothetical protein [Nostoc sp. ChiSLP03a]|nr:hypothetical protein [Nostoc sp. ChiSLP03a]MDZ7968586.1 hypothetical protein [Nostoc sp. DedSLP03]MDZ8215726.1 hypothetical protein [Nostoc sp. ChiSLP03a]